MSHVLQGKIDYLRNRERGAIVKDPGGRVRVCLIYPNTYHVGMSNLGFQGVYGLFNADDRVACERAFLPDDSDLGEHVRTGTPVLSIETLTPITAFDILAFSLSFENDYQEIPRILNLSRIPLRPGERTAYHPLVIAGGVCTFSNPEPVAPFFDLVVIGEAEEVLDQLITVYLECDTRDQLKLRALEVQSIYVPEFYEITYDDQGRIADRRALHGASELVVKRTVSNLSASPLRTVVTSPDTEFSNMCLMEAMRGCPWSCRFCLVGRTYNPPRRKELAALAAEIECVTEPGVRVGLVGPSLSDYPHLGELLDGEGVEFSITSLRASRRSGELIRFLKGRKSVSIAPEAGTERLRRVVDKRVSEEDIIETAGLLFDAGIANLRLYFMIGLPTERQEDIEGIVAIVKRVRALADRGRVVVSVSSFVPKPFTPFQWHPMAPLADLKDGLKTIRRALQQPRVKVLHDVPKYALMQGILSRGDRRTAEMIEGMAAGLELSKACGAAGLRENFYLFRERVREELLPWDFIDAGVIKEQLWEEYQEAMAT